MREVSAYSFYEGALTLLPPFVTAKSLPFMSAFDFCLFTTIWEDPKEFEAGVSQRTF